MFFNTKNSLKLILFAGSSCSMGHPTYVEPALTMITSMFTTHLCINSKNGCEEELDDKKLEDHEKYCIFQNVPCPVITCTKSIVFQDVQKHLDETHKCLKVDSEWLIHTGEWEFEGTLEEMIQNVCCLSSYGQQFFVQFEKYEKKCFGTWICGHQCHTRNAHGGCHGYGRGVCDQWHTMLPPRRAVPCRGACTSLLCASPSVQSRCFNWFFFLRQLERSLREASAVVDSVLLPH